MTYNFNFGFDSEKMMMPIIEHILQESLKKSDDTYCVYDFYNENCFVELKTRKCSKLKYKSIMIGTNKMDFFKQQTKKCYCFWKFQDGLFYWKYNKAEVYCTIEQKISYISTKYLTECNMSQG